MHAAGRLIKHRRVTGEVPSTAAPISPGWSARIR
jgi:hypothetical protein